MSDRAAERNIAARHIAFARAVRERDPLEAARSASRLRLPGAFLTVGELMAGRRARAAVGRALVRARIAQDRPSLAARGGVAAEPAPVTRRLRRPSLPVWRALAVVGVIALLLVLFRPGGGFFGGGSTEQQKPGGVNVPPDATLRGRSASQASFVVVVTPAPATQTPPVAVPGTSASPAPIGGGGGGSPVPGGGGGFGSPGPAGTPPLPGLDFGRITVIVTDSATQQPISGVCITMGSDRCNGTTDAQGRWSADIKLPAPRVPFDLAFTKTGYPRDVEHVDLVQGRETVVHVTLVRG